MGENLEVFYSFWQQLQPTYERVEFVEYCADIVPGEVWIGAEPEEITLNYLSESLPENLLKFNMFQKDPFNFLFSGYNETLKREVFRAHFLFRKKMTH
jgi:hypothetical protein